MATRRVFVIWTHALFHEAVRQLLVHPDVEYVGATSDRAIAREQIVSLQPDTVLIEEGKDDSVVAEVLEILKSSRGGTRVIRLSLANNDLSVYQREQRTVGQGEDLLHLIQNE